MEGSWHALVRAIVGMFPHAVIENATSLRCVVVVDGTRVGMRVRKTYAYESPVVVIVADLGPSVRISARDSLACNAILASGSLAVERGVLFLKAIIEDGTASANVLDKLALLAREAATLKCAIPSRESALGAFACFAD